MKRGRPKKVVLSPLDLKKAALEKYHNGYPLSLEETAHAMWDPKTEKKPMTEMGVLKMQNRALEKMKMYISSKSNINTINDFLSNRELSK